MQPDQPVNIEVRRMIESDVAILKGAFPHLAESYPGLYEKYLSEQPGDVRPVLVALYDEAVACYLTILWQSNYPPFAAAGVPEINNFEVVEPLRRRGIGTRLIEEAELLIATRSSIAGIGVGVFADYGPAQRLYMKRGYVADGRGLWSHDHHIVFGERPPVDHDLALWLTKSL